jgi:FkbM family methyltransferase
MDPRFTNDKTVAANTFAAPFHLAIINRTLGILRERHDQYTLVPAACGETNGYSEFNLGDIYNSGVGSLFEANNVLHRGRAVACKTCDGRIGVATVPLIRLDSILEHVRSDAQLEVLKIDAQSADGEVLRGVGQHLKRFKCVIGEFGASGYAIPEDRVQSDSSGAKTSGDLLKVNGFRFYKDVWFNLHALQHFKNSKVPNLCFSHEMKAPLLNSDIANFLTKSN